MVPLDGRALLEKGRFMPSFSFGGPDGAGAVAHWAHTVKQLLPATARVWIASEEA